MTSSEMAGYQSEAQEVTGRGSAFPHNTCAVRKGSGYPRRGLKIPLRYQKSAPCPQAYTHTGTMGRHKKLHILSILHILNSIKN